MDTHAGCDHACGPAATWSCVQGPPQAPLAPGPAAGPRLLQCPSACSCVYLPGCSWVRHHPRNAPCGPHSPNACGSNCAPPQRTLAPRQQWPARVDSGRRQGRRGAVVSWEWGVCGASEEAERGGRVRLGKREAEKEGGRGEEGGEAGEPLGSGRWWVGRASAGAPRHARGSSTQRGLFLEESEVTAESI